VVDDESIDRTGDIARAYVVLRDDTKNVSGLSKFGGQSGKRRDPCIS